MQKKFFIWTRVFLLIGLVAGTLNAMPVQASGSQPNTVHDAKSFVAPPKPVLVSPAKGVLVKTLSPALKWKVNGADHYRVQVAYDSLFDNLFNEIVITAVQISQGFVYAPQLPPGTRFFWRVQGYSASDEASPWSPIWNFKTYLVPPVLVAPAVGEPLLTDRPTFEWNSVLTATQYVLQVSAVNNFSTLLLNTPVNSTQYTMKKDLPQNKTIYWRVRSKSATLTSAFSAKRSFITGNPPSVPVLLTPANGALVYNYTPILEWKDSTNPSGPTFKQYEIEVDNNIDFLSPEIPNTAVGLNDITGSTFTPGTALTPNMKYYWRVRAINTIAPDDHTSGWSTIWAFRAAIPAPTSFDVIPTTNALRPSFDWDDATPPISNYTLQFSTVANFSTVLVNSISVPSSYNLTKNLPTGKIIYWRLRVNGANGPSAWTTGQFTTPVP